MSNSKTDESKDYPLRVDVPFDSEEKKKYKKWLRDNGYSSGLYVRTLLLKEMKKEQAS